MKDQETFAYTHSHDGLGEHTHMVETDGARLHEHVLEAAGHTHPHVHENQKAVINRLARAIGHLEHVKRMVEAGRDCSEVLVQLSAVRSALTSTGKLILEDHIHHCVVDAVETNDRQSLDDLCAAIEKFVK